MLVCKDFQQQAIWRIFAIRRLLQVMYNDIVKHRLHVWYICPQCPPLAACPRSVAWILLTVPQWARRVRWPQPGLSLRHPPASEKLFMKPIPSHRIQSCEDGVDIISFIFFSFAARARGPPSPCLNLAASLSIRTHFLPTLPQFTQFYSHSSLHNHVCHYTFSNAFSDPVEKEKNEEHGILLFNC